jgi:hypothetical protein
MAELEIKHEHSEDPATRRVGIIVGIVGILLAVVTIASHRAHTNAVIHRTEANDQWSYYQAKKIRANTTEIAQSLLQSLGTDPARTEEALKKLEGQKAKYDGDAEKIQEEARHRDEASEVEEHRALYFDIGEGLLELGLVLNSLFFLSRSSFFPVFGGIASVTGTVLAIVGALLVK